MCYLPTGDSSSAAGAMHVGNNQSQLAVVSTNSDKYTNTCYMLSHATCTSAFLGYISLCGGTMELPALVLVAIALLGRAVDFSVLDVPNYFGR